MIPNAEGLFVKLYDNKGIALKASADADTFVAVVYNGDYTFDETYKN